MSNLTNIPAIDGFETTLAQSRDGAVGTVFLNDTPAVTLGSNTTCIVVEPGKTNMQTAVINAINTTLDTVTVSSIAVNKGLGVAYSQNSHPAGSKVIISDNYQFWEDIQTALNSKLDNDGGNTTTTWDLQVSGSNFRLRLDAGDMKFTDDNQAEVTLSQLASLSGVNDKVKISVADTTEAYLDSKLTAGDGLSKAIVNGGGNETLDIDVDTTDTTVFVKTSSGASDEDKVPVLDSAGQLASGFIPFSPAILPDTTATGRAEEAIDEDEAVSAIAGRMQSVSTNDMNTVAWGTGGSGPTGPTSFSTGFAFTVRAGETGEITSIQSLFQCIKQAGTFGPDNTVTITGAFKIYAATGTPGSNALPTGSVLHTSTTVGVQFDTSDGVQGGSRVTKAPATATFTGATLSAGNYVIQYEGTVSGGGANNDATGTAGFAGDTSASMFQINGVQGGVTADATDIMYFYMNLADNYVYKARADNTFKQAFRGFASATVAQGASITYSTQGKQNITSTVNTVYYLSDTPGDISTTAGTLPNMVGYAISTDLLMLGVPFMKAETATLTSGTTYYAGCNGFVMVDSAGAASSSILVQTGNDPFNVTTTVAQSSEPGTNNANPGLMTIPIAKGKFYKATFTGAAATIYKFVPSYI